MSRWNWLLNLPGILPTVSRSRQSRRRPSAHTGDCVAAIEHLELRSLLSVNSFVKIADQLGGGPDLAPGENFGKSVTAIGDLDLDGVIDLAVGSDGDFAANSRGTVHILFMNSNGTVKSFTEISSGVNGGPTLTAADIFGRSVAGIGDIDGDNVPDLAVGAVGDDTGGVDRGAVYILFMNSNGSAKSFTKIASGLSNAPTLANLDNFGHSLAALGDLNGDSITDLAVGALYDSTVVQRAGAVHILYLNADGTVQSSTKIASGVNGGPTLSDSDVFGSSIASLGDVDGDAVNDLAVGAFEDRTGGLARGAVYVLLMNADETVKSSTKIAHNLNGGPSLTDIDEFGWTVAGLGDLDGDGTVDLAVGAPGDDTGIAQAGAVHVLFLNQNGTARKTWKIGKDLNGGPGIANDGFGASVANIGSQGGSPALAVGADFDHLTGDNNAGAIYILQVDETDSQAPTIAINGSAVTYIKNAAPIAVVPAVTLDDADTEPVLQIPGGQLIISVNTLIANKKGTKVFDTFNTSSLNSVGAVGSPQVVGGRIQITVDLSESATLTQIRDALRGITFSSTKKGLKTTTRDLRLQVIDRAGAASAVVTQTINVRKKAAPS